MSSNNNRISRRYSADASDKDVALDLISASQDIVSLYETINKQQKEIERLSEMKRVSKIQRTSGPIKSYIQNENRSTVKSKSSIHWQPEQTLVGNLEDDGSDSTTDAIKGVRSWVQQISRESEQDSEPKEEKSEDNIQEALLRRMTDLEESNQELRRSFRSMQIQEERNQHISGITPHKSFVVSELNKMEKQTESTKLENEIVEDDNKVIDTKDEEQEIVEENDSNNEVDQEVKLLKKEQKALTLKVAVLEQQLKQTALFEMSNKEEMSRQSLAEKDKEIPQLQGLMIENYNAGTPKYQQEKDENGRLSRELSKLNESLKAMQEKLALKEIESLQTEKRENETSDDRKTLLQKVRNLEEENKELRSLLDEGKAANHRCPLLHGHFTLEQSSEWIQQVDRDCLWLKRQQTDLQEKKSWKDEAKDFERGNESTCHTHNISERLLQKVMKLERHNQELRALMERQEQRISNMMLRKSLILDEKLSMKNVGLDDDEQFGSSVSKIVHEDPRIVCQASPFLVAHGRNNPGNARKQAKKCAVFKLSIGRYVPISNSKRIYKEMMKRIEYGHKFQQ